MLELTQITAENAKAFRALIRADMIYGVQKSKKISDLDR